MSIPFDLAEQPDPENEDWQISPRVKLMTRSVELAGFIMYLQEEDFLVAHLLGQHALEEASLPLYFRYYYEGHIATFPHVQPQSKQRRRERARTVGLAIVDQWGYPDVGGMRIF